MKNAFFSMPATRREFLTMGAKGIGLLAFTRFAPSFLTQPALAGQPAPESDRTILVVVQLAGGNDGLNTLIPYEDSDYYRLRPTIGIRKNKVIPLHDNLGLNPGMEAMSELFKEGRLAIVQNVGYPNPNRSHFRSTEIWETAGDSNKTLDTGWLGRFFDNDCAGIPEHEAPVGIHVTNQVPEAYLSKTPHNTFGLNVGGRFNRHYRDDIKLIETLVDHTDDDNANTSFLKHTMMDAFVTEKKVAKFLGEYKTDTHYPETSFARSLRDVAALIAGNLPTRVYFVSLGGFDTHRNQEGTHTNLLKTLSEGMQAFQRDLEAKGLGEQVLTMTFSEFGRRSSENESKGTDHGTSAPLFVMGKKLKGGLYGTAPSLKVKHNQDLTFSTDFRQVYSTVLDSWMKCDAKTILGGNFKKVDLV